MWFTFVNDHSTAKDYSHPKKNCGKGIETSTLDFDENRSWIAYDAKIAHTVECEMVWISCWRRAVSGVGCQILIVGIAHFLLVPRIKSLQTPSKSGLRPEVNGWLGLAQSCT